MDEPYKDIMGLFFIIIFILILKLFYVYRIN